MSFKTIKLSQKNSQNQTSKDLKPQKSRKNTLWTIQENIKYINFIDLQRDLLKSEDSRRTNSVFVKLSKMIPTRTSDQCRSHHQKMMITHKNIQKIIIHLSEKIQRKLSLKKIKLNSLEDEKYNMLQKENNLIQIMDQMVTKQKQFDLWAQCLEL